MSNFKRGPRLPLGYGFNQTALSQALAQRGDFDVSEFADSRLSKHTQDEVFKLAKLVKALEFALFDEAGVACVRESNAEFVLATKLLEIRLKAARELLEFYRQNDDIKRNEWNYGKVKAAKKAGARGVNLDQAQDTVYKIAAQLRNAQISGDSELESVLRFELQAAEARLNLLKKS